jgi:hypothetical protein
LAAMDKLARRDDIEIPQKLSGMSLVNVPA